MGRILTKPLLRDGCIGVGLLLAAAALIFWPDQTAQAVREGLHLCGNVIVPSLFPFFLLSSLVVELGLSRYLGRALSPVMAPLFRVNGNCAAALVLGAVGGYPVGARTAIQLYQEGQCTKTEAERLLAFCNNCGPAFILGVVGAGIFGDHRVGLLLYAAHLGASLLVGLFFRFYRPGERPCPAGHMLSPFQTVHFSSAFTHAVSGSLQSCLNITAFILCFSVILRLLALSGLLDAGAAILSAILSPLGLDRVWAGRLITGLLELSSGVSSLTDGSAAGRISMAAFMLGWAGLSVHCQVLVFLGDSGLSMWTYLVGKLLHGGLSALLTAILVHLCALELPACLYLSEQTRAVAELTFHQALALSSVTAWWMWLGLLALALFATKNSGRKKKKYTV